MNAVTVRKSSPMQVKPFAVIYERSWRYFVFPHVKERRIGMVCLRW